MNKKEINIIFSTKNIENTTNLLSSIVSNCSLKRVKNYSLVITIFDKTYAQNILSIIKQFDLNIHVIDQFKIKDLEEKHSEFLCLANCSTKVDSIQRARIQQQIYIIENYEQFKYSIIWQVDDDIIFGKSSYKNNQHSVIFSIDYFSEIVEFYNHNKSIDAIISPTSYVPPIPSLLYCHTQLEDIFNREYKEISPFYSGEYHDYYNQYNNEKYYSIFLSERQNKNEIVKNILLGRPVTKVAFNEKESLIAKPQKSKLLRGGNFIVFNIEVFRIPHLGFSEGNSIPARRSDMIHSHLLLELGFTVADVDFFTLVHNRTFSNETIEVSTEKYFSDMVGALLVQYLYKGEKEFENRLEFHQNHIKKIVTLLQNNVDVGIFEKEINKLKKLDLQINSFDKGYFIKEFEDFKKIKKKLILRLCKLVS